MQPHAAAVAVTRAVASTAVAAAASEAELVTRYDPLQQAEVLYPLVACLAISPAVAVVVAVAAALVVLLVVVTFAQQVRIAHLFLYDLHL